MGLVLRGAFRGGSSDAARKRGGSPEGLTPLGSKKMVPSDRISSLARRRYTQRRTPQTVAPGVSLLGSPAAGFLCQRPAHSLKARRGSATARDRLLASAFPSPATPPAFAGPIPGSTALACCFASPAVCFLRPFGLRLHNRSGFRSRSRLLHRLKPVALSAICLAGCSFRLHSPSGLLPPSGSKRSAELAACRPAFRSARSPLAPRRRFYC